jgi:hypothetical protein
LLVVHGLRLGVHVVENGVRHRLGRLELSSVIWEAEEIDSDVVVRASRAGTHGASNMFHAMLVEAPAHVVLHIVVGLPSREHNGDDDHSAHSMRLLHILAAAAFFLIAIEHADLLSSARVGAARRLADDVDAGVGSVHAVTRITGRVVGRGIVLIRVVVLIRIVVLVGVII